MNVTIAFKNMKHSDAVEERIIEKLEKLNKFLISGCDISCSCFKHEKDYCLEVQICGQHFDYHATASSINLYKAIDAVVSKLYKQLGKKREKWKNKKIHHKHQWFERRDLHFLTRELKVVDPEAAWEGHDDEDESDEDFYIRKAG